MTAAAVTSPTLGRQAVKDIQLALGVLRGPGQGRGLERGDGELSADRAGGRERVGAARAQAGAGGLWAGSLPQRAR